MAAIDNPVVGDLYWVYLKFPRDLNLKSPEKGQHRAIPAQDADGWHTIDSPVSTGNIRSTSRHIGTLIHYDSMSKIGALFISTGAIPDHPHRFVAWKGTQRLAEQPFNALIPEPEDSFLTLPGYFNFTHLIRARVIQQGEPGVLLSFPGPIYLREMSAGPVLLESSLPAASISYLKSLHGDYWSGIRYSKNGEVIPASHWGSGGSGSAGGSTGIPPSGGGRHGTFQGRESTARAQGAANPVHPGTGFTYSYLMEIAALQATVSDAQAKLSAGELDDELEPYNVALFPLVAGVIPHSDQFPPQIVGSFPDGIL